MKFRKFGQVLLASVVSTGFMLGVTSCANDFTVGYVYVTGLNSASQGGLIGAYKEDNNDGILRNVIGSPFGSSGTNPIRAIIPSGGHFVFVLNAGQQTLTTNTSTGLPEISYSGSNISVFSIGGYGQLSFQSSYNSQGIGPIRLAADSTGTHLFVLDSYSPIGNSTGNITTASATQTANFPCQDSSGIFRPVGDVTVFDIDTSTGRLALVTNQQQQNLTYFPIGCAPVDFHVTPGYVYAADAGSATNNDLQTIFVYALASSTGQLTQTQNAPLQTGATQIASITADSANKYIYVIDSGADYILPYTIGSQGALTAINSGPTNNATYSAAGNPQQLIEVTGSPNNFVFVANAGPASGTNIGSSDISGYVINATTGHLDQPTYQSPYGLGTVSGAVCIFEDPSNQYIYMAGAGDNTIVGRKLDPGTGSLKPLTKSTAFTTVGTPSWCLSTSASR